MNFGQIMGYAVCNPQIFVNKKKKQYCVVRIIPNHAEQQDNWEDRTPVTLYAFEHHVPYIMDYLRAGSWASIQYRPVTRYDKVKGYASKIEVTTLNIKHIEIHNKCEIRKNKYIGKKGLKNKNYTTFSAAERAKEKEMMKPFKDALDYLDID